MKIEKKLILSIAAAAFAVTAAFAQDDFDFGGFDEADAGSESTVVISGAAEANARAYYKQTNEGVKYFDDFKDLKDMKTWTNPSASINVNYNGLSTDFEAKLKFSKTIFEDYKEDVLQEFTARAYLGNVQLEAGKMKVVWGKGDKNHVLDNFNANDYTDYIIPDYIDRRLAEPMFRAIFSTNSSLKFEGIFTPWMTPDRLGTGIWQPAAVGKLTSTVTELVMAQAAANAETWRQSGSQTALSGLLNNLQFDSNSMYPDTQTLKYCQAGARTTFTLGSIDLGLSYYYGHNKQPTANTKSTVLYKAGVTPYTDEASGTTFTSVVYALAYKVGVETVYKKAYTAAVMGGADAATADTIAKNAVTTNMATIKAEAQTAEDTFRAENTLAKAIPSIDYDMVQVFGLEGAFVLLGRLNSRFEVAYNLTKDIAGDDPWVKNNSIGWVAGFDIDLPVNNVNFNIQTAGNYIMHGKDIKDETMEVMGQQVKVGEYDCQYDADDIYTNNKIIVSITDTYNHEKVKVDLKGIYGIERKDLIVMPSLTIKAADDLTCNFSGLVIHSFDKDKSEFAGWLDNDFVEFSVKYQF